MCGTLLWYDGSYFERVDANTEIDLSKQNSYLKYIDKNDYINIDAYNDEDKDAALDKYNRSHKKKASHVHSI